jgi:diketogulonate reductase-like aldo/keto reductase
MKLNYPVDLQHAKIPLNHGNGEIPALGCGTLIPDKAETRKATQDALEAGFRHFDCAERYQNEREVGEGLQAGIAAKGVSREDLFITTKLWNSNHRPERVQPACEASMKKLGLDYLDLYLIHTPFAFKPGDDQDPRDESGNVIYDQGVTIFETWEAMETLLSKENAVRSDSPIAAWSACAAFLNLRGSSLPSCRLSLIRIFLRLNYWRFVMTKVLCCWLLLHWGMG